MPATPTVRINQKNLNIRISAIGRRVIGNIAEDEARRNVFEPALEKMLNDFNNHLVTQEIEEGNGAENISNTLAGNLRDVGNLYSFIGFPEGTDPIDPMRKYFTENENGGASIKLSKVSPKQLVFTFSVKAPDAEKIYSDSPLPWAPGLSWAKKIETGIAGASHFLRIMGRGRSKGGFQSEYEVGSIRFLPKTYISGIIGDFVRRISGRIKS